MIGVRQMKNSFRCFKVFQESTPRVTENLKMVKHSGLTSTNDKSVISLLFANAYIPKVDREQFIILFARNDEIEI